MNLGDFNPEVFKVAQRITRQVFGDPNQKEGPKQQSKIPKWNEGQRSKAIADPIGHVDYFTYPGYIDWDAVPPLKLRWVRLVNPKKAMARLNKRVKRLSERFGSMPINTGVAAISMLRGTDFHQRRSYLEDPVYGRFQDRTYTKPNRRYSELVGLRGKQLIAIWKRFGIDVEATWPDQFDYHPAGGAPMSPAGIALSRHHASWRPGPWEWHKNEFIVPNKLYQKFRFPSVNIRLLFHIIDKHKLVYTYPPPSKKDER